jgi:hypothetical protein
MGEQAGIDRGLSKDTDGTWRLEGSKMVAEYSHTSQQPRMDAVEKIGSYSPSIFPTPKTTESVSPLAPVAQVDRATVS